MPPSTAEIGEALEQTYRAHTGGRPGPAKRMHAFYVNAIACGEKTHKDFERHVKGLPECVEAKLREFREGYARDARAPSTPAKDAAFVDFVGACDELLDAPRIVEYVRCLPECASMWRDVVSDVYRNMNSLGDIDDGHANLFMKKWQGSVAYTAGSLRLDMEKMPRTNQLQQQSVNTNHHHIVVAHHAAAAAAAAAPSSSSSSHSNSYSTTTTYNRELVDAFEATFGRPMFVPEYFKYCDVDPSELPGLCVRHSRRRERVSDVHNRFLNVDVSEHEFVTKYLDACDSPSFYAELEETILDSQEYRDAMRRVLSDVYQSMYDAAIEPRELAHLFERVRADRGELDADARTEHVTDFKAERDDIVERIETMYTQCLNRAPDPQEVDEHVLLYRTRRDSADDELEAALCASLEFHDVIKAHLRALSGNNIMSSKLYEMLKAVVADPRSCTLGGMREASSRVVAA